MTASGPTPLVIAGAGGRMGRMLSSLAARDPALRVAGAFEAPGHPGIGTDAGALAAAGELGIRVVDRAETALGQAGGGPGRAVLIDFTWPEPSLANLRAAAEAGAAAVVGTTGFRPEQQREIEALAGRMPLVQASNMSVGVTLLAEVVTEVARRLGDSFDIEVVEAHHRLKKDAPSGTALTLARAAAAGRDARIEDWGVYGREGQTGERPREQIGVLALRGGDVIGDHTVFFFGTGERIELTHRAQSREAFASGALRAARWVAGRAPGLYSMHDVLFGAA
jgi:4-hydroxy-tetrahydrodipicolinate reductase